MRLAIFDDRLMTVFEIQRGSGVAAWRQIESCLREEIVGGTLQPGQKIATETRLSERFGVNRHTVRRALSALAEEGLVSIEQGRGTFVRDQVVDYPIGSRTRFSEIIAAQAHQPSGRLLHAEATSAPADVAKPLGIKRGVRVLRLDTLNLSDGVPIGTATNWFPARRFPELIAVFSETGSISAALAHHGVGDYRREWTSLVARMPSRDDADLLRQAPNRPILVAESVNTDAAGVPVQFSRTRFAAGRVQILLRS